MEFDEKEKVNYMNKPRVSVLMATYNTPEEWICEAIDSILKQTYSDFEFIIVDDCSTQNMDKVKEKYLDNRIIWVRNKENMGLTKSLNRALEMAKGEYIARIDSDDIAMPERLEVQVSFMDRHPEIIVSGTYRRAFGTENKDEKWNLPITREEQQAQLFFFNCGVTHPTAMLRKSMLDEYGIKYNENYKKAQDYGMWVQCTRYAPMAMIPQILLKYRKSSQQISCAGRMSQKENAARVKIDQLEAIGIFATEKEKNLHIAFCLNETTVDVNALECWIERLRYANDVTSYFEKRVFERILAKRWYDWCKKAYKLEKRTNVKKAYRKAWRLSFALKDVEISVKNKIMRILNK